MFILSLTLLLVIIFTSMIFFLRNILNRNIGAATAHLEQLSSEYAKKEEETRKQYEDAKRQAQEILANAQKDAEQQKQRILKEAQEEKEKILNEAYQKADEIIQQADRSRQALLDEMNQKIVEKALNRAAELIQEVLPERLRERIHRHWLDELISSSSSFEQLDRLHLPEGILEARAISAFALTLEQHKALKAKVEEKLGRQINLKEEVDAGIIAGLIVNIGSLVLDGSLRFKIQQITTAQQPSV